MYLLLPFLSLLSFSAASPLSPRQETCYSGAYVIVAPPKGSTTPGLQQTLVDDVLNAIPSSGSYTVPYNSSNTDLPAAIAQGVQLMTQEIESYAAACPSSPIVLMGYSLGGIVTMSTICGDADDGSNQLPTSYASNIAAIVAYGEETFVTGQPWDAGTCTAGTSDHPRANSALCDPFGSAIKSYCDSGDVFCCHGNDSNAHFAYANEYDSDATNFVVSKYQAFSKRR